MVVRGRRRRRCGAGGAVAVWERCGGGGAGGVWGQCVAGDAGGVWPAVRWWCEAAARWWCGAGGAVAVWERCGAGGAGGSAVVVRWWCETAGGNNKALVLVPGSWTNGSFPTAKQRKK